MITWIMPVKNGLPYLIDTLKSIAAQTVRGHQIYVWDNGSTDGTIELLQDWIPSKIAGKLYLGDPLSYSESLRRLVVEANTPICARIDADDVNHTNRLQLQLQYLNAHPEVVAVGGQVNRIGPDGINHGAYFQLPCDHEDIVVRMMRSWGMWHPTVLFRRAAVLAAGNYFDERPVEDYSLWLRLARQGRLANLSDVLLDYRVHDASVTQGAKSDGTLREAISTVVVSYGPELYGINKNELRDAFAGNALTLRQMFLMWRRLRENHCQSISLIWVIWRQETMIWLRKTIGFRLAVRAITKLFRLFKHRTQPFKLHEHS